MFWQGPVALGAFPWGRNQWAHDLEFEEEQKDSLHHTNPEQKRCPAMSDDFILLISLYFVLNLF